MPRLFPLAPTLTVVVLLAVLVSLGLWQIDRMHQKEAMLARYQANSAAAPAPLPLRIERPEDFAFRRVLLACVFEGEARLSPGASPAGKAGQHVYALCREAGRGERVVVDLGWQPMQAAAPVVAGLEAHVQGVARPWFGHTMVERLSGSARVSPESFGGGAPVAPVFVQAERVAPLAGSVFPEVRPSPVRPEAIPNNHRSYAIQWFLFALTLLVIYGVYLYRWRRLQRESGGDTVRRH